MDVEQHLPLVRSIAKHMHSKLPYHAIVDFGDLVSYGTIGLIDAAKKFDPNQKANFKTYASLRIRGEIKDSLRRIDPLSRHHRKEVMAGDKVYFVPLEEEKLPYRDTNYVNQLTALKTKNIVLNTEVLDRQERLTVLLYFWHDLEYDTIATILNVTPGRISQIKKVAFDKLKQATLTNNAKVISNRIH